MCGIVAYIGSKAAVPFLLEGLYTLEYRGYDSAGIALVEHCDKSKDQTAQSLRIVKRVGAVKELDKAITPLNSQACCGIGHTRWATHGAPSEANAHPHTDGDKSIALVHNGIIENHYDLRQELIAKGYSFVSETDTEVVVLLLKDCYLQEPDFKKAFANCIKRLEGSFALAAIHKDYPDTMCVARKGSPLVVAPTEDGIYVASDVLALSPHASQAYVLDNGQYAYLSMKTEPSLSFDISFKSIEDDQTVHPECLDIDKTQFRSGCGSFPDFMLKEIHEQPKVIQGLIDHYCRGEKLQLEGLEAIEEHFEHYKQICIVSCGTSHYASQVARFYLERFCKLPVMLEVASEFNYQDSLIDSSTLCMIITQSGETADTLAAARKMKGLGAQVLAITNVVGSSAARDCDGVLYTEAGPEVSVASTKSYTAQIFMLLLFALYMGQKLSKISDKDVQDALEDLRSLPDCMERSIRRSPEAKAATYLLEHAHSALFLGRGPHFATASEAALKLKELSYIHAESYPAGEMKHGPIALLEPGFPVVVIIPDDDTRAKTLSNIQEIIARGAQVIALASEGDTQILDLATETMFIPKIAQWLSPFIAIIPLQLFAREIARARGKNVDRPRNLAKSVTVE